MLYTTYYSKLQLLPNQYIKIIISLYPPKWISIDNSKNIFHSLDLAPDPEVFREYKETLDLDKYFKTFLNKLEYNSNTVNLIQNIIIALNNNKDIALICYEKNYLTCHRYVIAKYLQDKFNIIWKEF